MVPRDAGYRSRDIPRLVSVKLSIIFNHVDPLKTSWRAVSVVNGVSGGTMRTMTSREEALAAYCSAYDEGRVTLA